MQLRPAIERFHTHLEANGNSPHTRSSYLRDLGMLADALGDVALEGIGADDVARFLTSGAVTVKSNGSPKASGSVDKTRISFKAFFRWAHEAGLVEANPAAAVHVRHRRRPAPDVLTVQEKRRLVKAIDQTRGGKAERDATHLLERTGNLRTVQEALRHRNIATTVRYTHQPSEALAEALEALRCRPNSPHRLRLPGLGRCLVCLGRSQERR
jgi:site-specific recombinase XerD